MQRKSLVKIIVAILSAIFLAVVFWFMVAGGDVAPARDGEVATVQRKGELREVGGGMKQYISEYYGFSFLVPSEFTVGEFDEAGGRIVLVQDGSTETSFQIFISSYDEPAGSLTLERIREDLPELTILEPEALPMTGESDALAFIGEDPGFGQTREVWVVHDDNLYQIMTSIGNQNFLAEVLNSWEFQ